MQKCKGGTDSLRLSLNLHPCVLGRVCEATTPNYCIFLELASVCQDQLLCCLIGAWYCHFISTSCHVVRKKITFCYWVSTLAFSASFVLLCIFKKIFPFVENSLWFCNSSSLLKGLFLLGYMVRTFIIFFILSLWGCVSIRVGNGLVIWL